MFGAQATSLTQPLWPLNLSCSHLLLFKLQTITCLSDPPETNLASLSDQETALTPVLCAKIFSAAQVLSIFSFKRLFCGVCKWNQKKPWKVKSEMFESDDPTAKHNFP